MALKGELEAVANFDNQIYSLKKRINRDVFGDRKNRDPFGARKYWRPLI